MAEKIISITSIEQKTAQNNNPFLQLTDQDGKKYSIFDQAKWNLCQKNATVKLIGEQSGRFFNAEDVLPVKAGADMIVSGVLERGPDPTRKSIERQSALKASTEIAVAKIAVGKATSLNEILTVAVMFESYLESGAIVKKGESSE